MKLQYIGIYGLIMKALLVNLILATACFAAKPVLFFSDLTDGPTSGWNGSGTRGAAVSVWGLNFGDTRGTGYITCGNKALTSSASYAEWAATTNPTTARGLQRITFWLESGMQAGATTISVTTSEGTSNTIDFYCRDIGTNHIYFVATNGSDSNNGLADTSQGSGVGAWATPAKVRASLKAGDVAYFRSGVYTNVDDWDAVIDFWSNNHANGSANKSISIASYPAEAAQLGSKDNSRVIGHHGSTLDIISYWTFSKFIMVANSNVTHWVDGKDDHVRFIGNDGTTTYGTNGKTIFDFYAGRGGQTYFYFYGNYSHDAGVDNRSTQTPYSNGYPLYIEGSVPGTSPTGYESTIGHHNYIYIGWNEFAYCKKGRGLQLYGHQVFDQLDNAYIFGNWMHDNGLTGAVLGGGDGNGGSYSYKFARNIYFYNNIVNNNDTSGTGYPALLLGGVGWGVGGNYKIFNNTLHQNSSVLDITAGTESVQVVNNIMMGSHHFFDRNDGSDTTGYNNVYWGGASDYPSWDTNQIRQDPVLLDIASHNFAISKNSPCKDRGSNSTTLVQKDYNGTIRPQNDIIDIGAMEYYIESPKNLRTVSSSAN